MMRLDKFLCDAALITRSEARALLRAGRVFMHGNVARDGALKVDARASDITIDGKPVILPGEIHLMMNKPGGVLTAARDSRQKTVYDLLPEGFSRRGLMPVGRLDKDTEGLLLFTTDGTLHHRLLSPKQLVEKEYIAEVDGVLDAGDVLAFSEGLVLSDFTAMPARLEILPGEKSGRVTVHEGKYHQVKRMFASRGKPVTALRREKLGGIALDASLAPGSYRELTQWEAAQLYAAAGMDVPDEKA